MTDFSEGMEVLMLIVLLYFLLSLSIQLVVYMHLCTWLGVHICEICTVAFGLVLSQGRVLAFPFLDKGNELSVSLEGFHLVVLQWEHLADLLSHCQFVLMGHAVKCLHTEDWQRRTKTKKMLKRSALAFFCWCMKGGVVKGKQGCVGFSSSPMDSSRNLEPARENGFAFVKKVLKENGNFGLALQKRLFCIAKQPLLPCKTYAFGMRNNRFCKALIASKLCKTLAREKCLRIYGR